jgi:hypothetical protein
MNGAASVLSRCEKASRLADLVTGAGQVKVVVEGPQVSFIRRNDLLGSVEDRQFAEFFDAAPAWLHSLAETVATIDFAHTPRATGRGMCPECRQPGPCHTHQLIQAQLIEVPGARPATATAASHFPGLAWYASASRLAGLVTGAGQVKVVVVGPQVSFIRRNDLLGSVEDRQFAEFFDAAPAWLLSLATTVATAYTAHTPLVDGGGMCPECRQPGPCHTRQLIHARIPDAYDTALAGTRHYPRSWKRTR